MAVGHAGKTQRHTVNIRPATEEDFDAIHAVHVASMKHLRETAPSADEKERKGVDAFIAKRCPADVAAEMRAQRFVVMEDDSGILGFGALHVPKAEITMVFVCPTHQRQGIGRALLAELESMASLAGLNEVQLRATGMAIGFYLKTGYQSDPPVRPDAEWALMMKNVV
jgi:GNAT superfamily N-acetyltransferase